MSTSRPTIAAYLALLALSVPIPLLHSYYTDDVIATMRPVIKNADGSWTPMLMPVPILFLRWLGQLSWWLPFVVLALLVLSFRRKSFAQWETVCAVAVAQCAFNTFYALYATWLLGSQWLEWIHRAP